MHLRLLEFKGFSSRLCRAAAGAPTRPNFIYMDLPVKVGFPWAAKFCTFDLLQRCWTLDSTSGFIGYRSLGKEKKVRRAQGKRDRMTGPGSVLLPSKGLCSPSGLPVTVHQGDDENRDVVAGAQPLVGDPPPSVPQHAACTHYQVLRRHRVPARHRKGDCYADSGLTGEAIGRLRTCKGRQGHSWRGTCWRLLLLPGWRERPRVHLFPWPGRRRLCARSVSGYKL